MPLNIMTLNIIKSFRATFRIMPLSKMTLSITKTQHNDTQHTALSITAIIIVTLGKITT
jgi:hypothetical protein